MSIQSRKISALEETTLNGIQMEKDTVMRVQNYMEGRKFLTWTHLDFASSLDLQLQHRIAWLGHRNQKESCLVPGYFTLYGES